MICAIVFFRKVGIANTLAFLETFSSLVFNAAFGVTFPPFSIEKEISTSMTIRIYAC